MNSMEPDNHDERIRYYELLLERDLERLPDFKLPEGFRFVFYQPGDRDRWIDIEKSAKEFTSYEQGLRSWNRTEHPVLSDLERVSADEILKGMEVFMNYEMIRLEDRPELMEQAAEWFHKKWGIPLAAYQESMEECLTGEHVVPQWYVTLEGTHIIGGMGVIENDFHDRKDLAPNVCAVYTEEDKRGQGVAGQLLDFVCRDMRSRGIDTLYLVTDHTSFYERYGWEFLCMVQGDGEANMSRMYVHTSDGR